MDLIFDEVVPPTAITNIVKKNELVKIDKSTVVTQNNNFTFNSDKLPNDLLLANKLDYSEFEQKILL